MDDEGESEDAQDSAIALVPQEVDEIKALRDGAHILTVQAARIEDRLERVDDKITEGSLWAALGGAAVAIPAAILGGVPAEIMGIAAGGLLTVYTSGQLIWQRAKRRLRARFKGYRILAKRCEETAAALEFDELSAEIEGDQ